jgi:hypothetical protein
MKEAGYLILACRKSYKNYLSSNLPVKMTGNPTVANTHSHKYYLVRLIIT